jgi:hypothetical protein
VGRPASHEAASRKQLPHVAALRVNASWQLVLAGMLSAAPYDARICIVLKCSTTAGPAARGGVCVGDSILAVDNRPVASSMEVLFARLAAPLPLATAVEFVCKHILTRPF